jgi:GlpG protein
VRPPPSIADAPRYPITSVISLLAIGVTLTFWNHTNVSMLMMDASAFGPEPWRLVTCVLPHGDMLHLAFNLYWFWALGTFLEGAFGQWRYPGILVLFAAGSAAAQWAVSGGAIGLSGVGYGLFAMLRALRNRPGFVGVVDKATATMFTTWFFVCIIMTWLGLMHIANTAHAAGAVLGFVLGKCVGTQGRQRMMFIATLVAVLMLIGVFATVWRPYVNLSRWG